MSALQSDETKTEQQLRNEYFRNRDIVIAILNREVKNDPQSAPAVQRFWWYRGEDEEVIRQEKFRIKTAEKKEKARLKAAELAKKTGKAAAA